MEGSKKEWTGFFCEPITRSTDGVHRRGGSEGRLAERDFQLVQSEATGFSSVGRKKSVAVFVAEV